MRRIAVWNTAFLGDAVLTLPLISTLKAAYPDAAIDFWVRKGFEGLFASQPELAGVYGYDKNGAQGGPGGTFALGRHMAAQGYSLFVSAHTSVRSGLMARWSSAKTRIGYDRPFLNRYFYTHTVPRCFDSMEEIERLLQLVKPLGISELHTWPRLVLPQDARHKAEGYFASHVKGPVVGLHPGSVWGTKRWPAASYAQVASHAVAAGAQVMIFAGPGEEAMAQDVISRIDTGGRRHAVLDLSGSLSLPELAAFLGRLDCYVTNDSGPMHLAWVQHTPVTAIFGPTVRRLGFFPRGSRSTVLEADVSCRPCGLHGPQECPQGHHRCMAEVTPGMVWADVERKLFRT
ncbi:glycosyl transferase family 9 [Oleidesulfovibrio alaskensis G20]|jgi:heptosyltransferase-2|uniref:Glycosyl transferase family 9 n=1 Tax=Oleidesulfovibrio alaskensis (strain ATCC BAA-1058 / DSM 17464 / G20) TaxID=207559 RepID=Q311W5_OLEA2|nr:glycosyltransferase family 9 protein [Oleidesulfovibrio alaskensis]ABB38281.1 glycosyl transferase family 9 [Oleidesulfovibrio alaskensis G20]MBG0774241.1 glycosyltransferase family 9 protein [Oleidesulfovibrio alaskensis]MBL3581219.1 glycosyltransferase family 9 protein [Oleidesulfovibrio alaskensis]